MKYAIAFIAAFALSAGVVAWVRVGASEAPAAPTDQTLPSTTKDPMAGHNMAD